jgi:hypothetical protein
MPALFVSFMRTAVPLVAGWLLTLAARAGFDVGDATAASLVTVVLAVVYDLAFRVLEVLGERSKGTALQTIAGVLLGWARPPQYPQLPGMQPAERADHTGPTRG